MSDRPSITQQYAFAVGEDGETESSIEPAEESVETSLETFGADVDHRERDIRIDQPEATSFGVDDRATVTRSDGGEQRALFADTDDDQQTLTGERAASKCLFESDDTDSDDESDTASAASASDEATATRAIATDGSHVEDPNDDTTEATDTSEGATVAIPRMKLAEVADYVRYERNTVERHADEGPKTEELTEYVEECQNALSDLDDSDEHGQIRRVVAAGAADELHESAERHHGDVERKLGELVDVLRQALETVAFDPDAETVTEAWEGAYIQASWGYNQTNVELAQITEVSESGKTVLARFVAAERVEHGRTSEQLRPTAEQYGDEFRLHVRNVSGDPAFRGSYPLGSDGDMDDGSTRRGSFYPFDNTAENSIRQTRTGFGH